MLQRTLPAGFIAPCLPTKTDKLPSGSQWLNEIEDDGFSDHRPEGRAAGLGAVEVPARTERKTWPGS
jgi:hypothetical protein